MRFMIIVKATRDSEAGVMPGEDLVAAMHKYHEELAKAGVLLDSSGLQSSAKGWRIKYSADKRTFVDGPFVETKELVAGYTLIRVASRAGGNRVDPAFSQSRGRSPGRRDRGAPTVRTRGFPGQRDNRPLSRVGSRNKIASPSPTSQGD